MGNELDYANKSSVGAMAGAAVQMIDHNPTIGENIDRRIERAIEQVERLKAVKAKMEKSGLLAVNIMDLRMAMDY